jgi:hypothetical protein
MTYPDTHTVWSNEQIEAWRDEVRNVLMPVALRDWLLSKADVVIGYAYDTHRCPIQNYLRDVVPHLDAVVGQCHVSCYLQFSSGFNHGRFKGLVVEDIIYVSSSTGTMPTWLTKYIKEIDDRFARSTIPWKFVQNKGEIPCTYFDYYVLGSDALALLLEMQPQLTRSSHDAAVEALTWFLSHPAETLTRTEFDFMFPNINYEDEETCSFYLTVYNTVVSVKSLERLKSWVEGYHTQVSRNWSALGISHS